MDRRDEKPRENEFREGRFRDNRDPSWERRERDEERDGTFREPYGEGQQFAGGGSRYAGDYDLRSGGRDFGEREYRRDSSDYAGFSPYSPYREGYRGRPGEPYYGQSGDPQDREWRGQYGPAPYGEAHGWYEGIGHRRSRYPNDEHHTRPQHRGPKGYRRSDSRIEEDVSDQLYQSEYIDSSEVTVKVKDGKVILEGTVPERWMKHAIEDVADQCSGVQDIENNIRVQRAQEQSDH